MKVNLIGMILNNAGRRCFDGFVIDDQGKHLPAADSLHMLIMEYAKVVNGGTSDLVVTSREVQRKLDADKAALAAGRAPDACPQRMTTKTPNSK